MEKDNKMLKSAMESGLIFGIILIAINIITYITGFKPFGIGKMIIMFIMYIALFYIAIYYFTRQYKFKILKGDISFSQAFLFSLLFIFFASFLFSFYNYIFNEYIDTEYAKKIFEESKEWVSNLLQQQGLSQDRIDSEIAKMDAKGIPTPIKSSINTIIYYLIIGGILSLITSSFLKKKKDTFDELNK